MAVSGRLWGAFHGRRQMATPLRIVTQLQDEWLLRSSLTWG